MTDTQISTSFFHSHAGRTLDRRTSARLLIEQDVCYKVLGRKKFVKQVGAGKTVNMSGKGVLFTTESGMAEGERVELTVSWPAQLDNRIPLKLVAIGVLVRTDATHAAMSIGSYEFKTRGGDLREKPSIRSSLNTEPDSAVGALKSA